MATAPKQNEPEQQRPAITGGSRVSPRDREVRQEAQARVDSLAAEDKRLGYRQMTVGEVAQGDLPKGTKVSIPAYHYYQGPAEILWDGVPRSAGVLMDSEKLSPELRRLLLNCHAGQYSCMIRVRGRTGCGDRLNAACVAADWIGENPIGPEWLPTLMEYSMPTGATNP